MVGETSVFEDIDAKARRQAARTLRGERQPTMSEIRQELATQRSLERERIKERRTLGRAREGFRKERREKLKVRAKKVSKFFTQSFPSIRRPPSRGLGVPTRDPFGAQKNPFAQRVKNPFMEE